MALDDTHLVDEAPTTPSRETIVRSSKPPIALPRTVTLDAPDRGAFVLDADEGEIWLKEKEDVRVAANDCACAVTATNDRDKTPGATREMIAESDLQVELMTAEPPTLVRAVNCALAPPPAALLLTQVTEKDPVDAAFVLTIELSTIAFTVTADVKVKRCPSTDAAMQDTSRKLAPMRA